MASILNRLFRRASPAKEKQWYNLPVSGGSVSSNWGTNWWQRGYTPTGTNGVATLSACVDSYAQTIAAMDVGVFDYAEDGTKTRVMNSAAARTLRNPNGYQTRSDFQLNLINSLLYHGNAYAVARRNDRNEIVELHQLPSRSTQAYVQPDTREIFYGAGDNPLLESAPQVLIPAREVLHLRLHTPDHPLIGVSPVRAAASSIVANGNITNHQARFFERMSRPSGVLSADQTLTASQMLELRKAWEEQSKDMDAGGVPILGSGMKWEPMSITSQDSQLIDAFNMSVMDIARAFRVPLPLVNLYEHASYNNVEQLYAQWLSGGLGFLLEHIERALERLFNMPDTRGVNFNADSLLRTDFQARVDGYTKLVQTGVYTVNEARAKFDGSLPVENGDTPIVQQQMVPLGFTPEPEPAPEPPAPEPEQQAAADPAVLKALMSERLTELKKRNAA
jgi:HK97 family phage portal protein